MELKEILTRIKENEEQLAWEGTFAEYFDLAIKQPSITRLAHARIYDSLLYPGLATGRLGQTQYAIFADQLFGIEDTIAQVIEYFRAGAHGFDTRKRILLLMGPPASGKSTLVNLIKQGLENYTRTEAGALYAIKGCPMQEDPLHLIPAEFRQEIFDQYGLQIEGDLCPHCRWMLEHTYRGDIEKVKVRRVTLNESMGVGIGTFVATDPASRELSRLTGSVDERPLSEDRLEAFGKAYRLDGELNVANRGLMEFIEIFKLDEKFLAVLLVLTEEQKIKAPGLGTIYADEAILAHSNEAEYDKVVADKTTEGLQDRIVVVHVPYNLRVSEEMQIYKKLLQDVDMKGVQISPLCLPVASIFAVLSRLEHSEKFGMSLEKKMRLYDGQYVARFSSKDIAEMHVEASREGMFGISPRFVINQISRAASQDERKYLDPLDLLQILWDGLEQNASLAHEERQHLMGLFQTARSEYDRLARREVQKACVDHFDQAADQLIQDYFQAVELHFNEAGQTSAHNGSSNETALRTMERTLNVQDYDSQEFRAGIQARLERLQQSGRPFDYRLDPRLEEAAVRQLCPNLNYIADILNSQPDQQAELFNQRERIKQRLIEERGYGDLCAEQLLQHVGRLSERLPRSNQRLPKALRWLRG